MNQEIKMIDKLMRGNAALEKEIQRLSGANRLMALLLHDVRLGLSWPSAPDVSGAAINDL